MKTKSISTRTKSRNLGCALLAGALLGGVAAAAPVECLLADNGRARLPVVTGEAAGETTRALAAELADTLGRIGGATFQVETGAGLRGIAVGLPVDFPELPFTVAFDPDDPDRREAYLLRTHRNGVWLLGATEAAVSHAVWDFLYRLGYRQYFPGEAWEIVPQRSRLSAAVDRLEKPSYVARNLRSRFMRQEDREAYAAWQARNRLAEGRQIASGHIYGTIFRAHPEVFEAHPEYRGLVDGERKGYKFCISNPGLRQLVVNFAIDYFENNPDADSISMEPSDGGDWCECTDCAALGSISDQAVFLANTVAEAVHARFPGKFVGMLAYNQHSEPPTIALHPRVAISVAAGYLRGGYRPEEMFAAWDARGGAGHFGVFEYYCNTTSRFTPRGQRIYDLVYLQHTIPRFHRKGARRMVSGTAAANGPVGLGAFVAARLLWDVEEAGRIEALYHEFLDKAFGTAREPMDAFYRLVYRVDNEDPNLPVTDDTVARMYRLLEEALALAETDAVRRRIGDLVLYTRFVELQFAYWRLDDDEAKLAADTELLRFVWRIRDTMMVNTYGQFVFNRRAVRQTYAWRPAEDHPLDLKDERPITEQDIREILRAGIANNPLVDYAVTPFSDDLAPAVMGLDKVSEDAGSVWLGHPGRGRQTYDLWLDDAPGGITLAVQGGMRLSNFGAVRVKLFKLVREEALDEVDPDMLYTASWIPRYGDLGHEPLVRPRNAIKVDATRVPADGEEHRITLNSRFRGRHRLEIDDYGGATRVRPVHDGMPFASYAGPDRPSNIGHVWGRWFYVPAGVRRLSVHLTLPWGRVLDGDGEIVHSFAKDEAPGYYNFPVPAGQDGRFWRLDRVRGEWRLLNVPPYLSMSPATLMLPREAMTP